jgi:hypothetical protein
MTDIIERATQEMQDKLPSVEVYLALMAEVHRLRAELTRRDEADRINNRNSTQKGGN